MNRASAAMLVALLSASCAARLMKLPGGPGTPAPNASIAVDEATFACRRVTTLTAEVAVRGSVAGRRLRVRLLAGFRAPASARLEAVAPFGAPLFVLVANAGDATLLLPRDNRVLEHAPADGVLEAIAGVPLNGAELGQTLTGCTATADTRDARQLGDAWLLVPDGAADIYLTRAHKNETWQLAAAVHRDRGRGEWRAEYRDFHNGLPQAIHLVSSDNRFDLALTLSQVETNQALAADAFRLQVPPNATAMTLNDLRESGLLASTRANDR